MVFNVEFDFHRTVEIDWIVKTECRDPGVFLINFDKDCSSFVIKRLQMIMVDIASFLASTLEKKIMVLRYNTSTVNLHCIVITKRQKS